MRNSHARLVHDIAEFVRDPYTPPRQPPDSHLMLGMEQFKYVRGYTNSASRLKVGPFRAFYAWFAVGFDGDGGVRLTRALAGQHVGLREELDGRWLVTFASIDLGYAQKGKSLDPIHPKPLQTLQ